MSPEYIIQYKVEDVSVCVGGHCFPGESLNEADRRKESEAVWKLVKV